jgi:hypothetical protein
VLAGLLLVGAGVAALFVRPMDAAGAPSDDDEAVPEPALLGEAA